MEYYSFYIYHDVIGAWVVPAAIAVAGIAANLWGQSRQNKANRDLARHQASINEAYLKQQNEYNTPTNQMLRYQQAGLNPNLVYGQGSPGNQSVPLSAPQQEPSRYGALGSGLSSLAPIVNQSMLAQSQVQANDAKTRHTYTLNALSQLQQRVLERNPVLDAGAYNAIIDSLKSAAEIKAADATVKSGYADWFSGESGFYDSKTGKRFHGPAGPLKMELELKMLEQKYDLGSADQKIKAEVLQSKEFQNDLLEIQTKWMQDAEITPQHILQFIQLLLMKML